MKNKWRALKTVGLALVLALSSNVISACKPKTDKLYFGICASPSEIYGSVKETCLTEGYIADTMGAMGCEAARVNFRFSIVFNTSLQSDQITFNVETVKKLHSFVDKLKQSGVKKIVALTDCYLYPYDYGHTINTCVPDPLLETEFYLRWLNINKKAWEMIAREFPEIDYFEPTNEPDHPNGGALNKNGYTYKGSQNDDFIWSYDDAGYIIADMCYYTREAVRSVDKENKVLLPGLCAFAGSFDYLQCIYNAIDSKTLPTGKSYSLIDPDNYFDVLNWHPYILNEGCGDIAEWSKFQKEFYAVAEKNGDKKKPVWFTEIGFTDSGYGEAVEQQKAKDLITLFDKTKKLGFVETAIVYCLTDHYDTPVSITEDHFGLIRSFAEPERGGEIKPIGEAMFYYINGKDANIQTLKDVVKKHYNIFHGITE